MMNILTAAVSAVIPHLPEAISVTWNHFTKEDENTTEKVEEPVTRIYGRLADFPEIPKIKSNASPEEIREAHSEYIRGIYNSSHRDITQKELVKAINQNLNTSYSYRVCWKIWNK